MAPGEVPALSLTRRPSSRQCGRVREDVDWFDEGGSQKRVDVAALLDSTASDALTEVVSLGALLSLGLTSDGGALGVTITVDGRWRREYFRDAEDLIGWLAEALPAVRSATEALLASSGPGNGQRRRRGR